jgi:hypothetical protein
MAKYLRYPLKNIGSQDDFFKIQIIKYEAPGLNLTGGFALRTTEQALEEASLKDPNKVKTPEATIILPMPQNIQDSNAADWSSGTMNPLNAATAVAANSAVLSDNVAKSLMKSLDNLGLNSQGILDSGEGQQGVAATAAALAARALTGQGGIDQIVSRATGQVFNQNVEVLFNGVQIRSAFQFSFDLVPRSKKESDIIKDIIRTFKTNMTPSKGTQTGTGNGLFIKAPNVFKLQYMSGGKQHQFLHRFKPCALTQMSVDYTGSGQYSTYSDATPVHMRLSLQFQELSPIYAEDYNTTEGRTGVGY